MFAPFIQYRELLIELTKREIKQRYKQSILGYAWVMLNPLIQMLVMAFVFSLILRVQDISVPYAVFLYAGLLPWNLFSTSLSSATSSLVSNSGLITKIYFPRDVFVISTLLSKVVDFALASIVFIFFLIYYRIEIHLSILWLIPLFSIQLIFTYGISLIAASFNLFYRDIQYVIGLLLVIWMYVTPVIYPLNMLPDRYHWIFSLNPMAAIINGYRTILFDGTSPSFERVGFALIISLVLLYIGFRIFKRLEGKFADVV